MKKRYLLLPCLLLALGVFVSACGGGGSSSSGGGSEEEAIETTIEESATSTEPSSCTEFATEAFLEETTGLEGEEAVTECEESVEEEEEAETAEVDQIEITGSEAVAEVRLTGGSLDGQSIGVSLVEEEEEWKMDSVIGFTVLDKTALAETIGSGLEEAGGASAEIAPCMEESIEESGQIQIEELLFAGSQVPIQELAQECQG